MCQLLGVSSNKKVNIQLSLREFRHRGEQNPHGFGFAFHRNTTWNVVKGPRSLAKEDVDEFKFRSSLIIGHVRFASCGNKTHQNTHPFVHGIWAFAHNGTVSAIKTKPEFALGKCKPIGQTDSEYAFCYLLERIGNETKIDKITEILKSESKEISRHGKFNYLLSDGEVLFAYGHDSLYFVKRKSPFQQVELNDDHYSIHLQDIKEPDEKAIIIATEPLTDERWVKLIGIKVFRDGED